MNTAEFKYPCPCCAGSGFVRYTSVSTEVEYDGRWKDASTNKESR